LVHDARGRRVKGLLRFKGGAIYVRQTFRKEGIPDLFMTTGETTLGRARTKAAILIQRHRNKHLGISDDHVFGRSRGKTLRQVAVEYLGKHSPELRQGTQELHEYYVNEVVDGLGHMGVQSITPQVGRDWIQEQKKRRKHRKTFFDFAKTLTALMNYAYTNRDCTHKFSLPNPDKDHHPTFKVYTKQEIAKLWKVSGSRLRDQLVLSYECGLRLREALKLELARVNFKTGEAHFGPQHVKTGSKTGRGRTIVLTPLALERLQGRVEILKKKFNSPYFFPSRFDPQKPQHDNKGAWRKAKADAKIFGRARWHDLRHTAITEALRAGKPIFQVSQYFGVSVRTIERVYAHLIAKDTAGTSTARIGEE
jgi:integrase